MSMINYRELRKRYEIDGAARTVGHLSEAIEKGDLKPEDFSLRELAEGLVSDGHAWVRELDPRSGGGISLRESIDGVDVTAFTNITGKILESKIMESYRNESFIASKLVDTIPSRFESERISSVSQIEGNALEVHPGTPYPNLGFSEDYTDTPRTSKHGLIVSVTKEAIFFDRTHLVLDRASKVGEILGLNKEKRILDVVLGLVNNYNWKGISYDSYNEASTTAPPAWVNSLSENELEDYSSVERMEQMIARITDPYTNEPIMIEPNAVLVMPGKRRLASRIFEAANVTYSDDNQSYVATVPNAFTRYKVFSSRIALQRLIKDGIDSEDAEGYWFMGDFKKAFAYMENWPITVTQSSPLSDADFSQDILVRFKASERGAAAVLNPRYVARSHA